MTETSTALTLTTEGRSEVLAGLLATETSHGWRVVSTTPTTAQLVKGKPTNHVLHLILTLITVGVWLPIWILVAIFAGQKQRFLSVGENGQVTRR